MPSLPAAAALADVISIASRLSRADLNALLKYARELDADPEVLRRERAEKKGRPHLAYPPYIEADVDRGRRRRRKKPQIAPPPPSARRTQRKISSPGGEK